ncbi:hypothetical protein PCH_Pc22g09360 [Penicillium rubens Wisconsin 54-1255]|uniref:Uncharacterized protein n=1 Tax=Penicillium rubens (strain ATCC 28089 / DSM 1075 / NRRL 1951 / Wisconsin 54-1255) TaxID=500485 RepID=B6HU09_PENRW|nr:hypothetical protein PCH_Pc22g09360 [Penicillium rubens Wisconsin 54-1255]
MPTVRLYFVQLVIQPQRGLDLRRLRRMPIRARGTRTSSRIQPQDNEWRIREVQRGLKHWHADRGTVRMIAPKQGVGENGLREELRHTATFVRDDRGSAYSVLWYSAYSGVNIMSLASRKKQARIARLVGKGSERW